MTSPSSMPPLPKQFIWNAPGANRFEYLSMDRLSEAFRTSHAPSVGDIGVALQTDTAEHDEPMVVGVGQVYSISGIASGTVRASFRPLYRLSKPVSLSGIMTTVGSVASLQDVPPMYFPVTLSANHGSAVLAAISAVEPGLGEWLARLTSPARSYSLGIEQARVEARDAVGLASQIADIELPADALVSDIEGVTDEDLLKSIINSAYEVDLEEELLPLDLQRFNKKLKVDQVAASMAVFTDKAKKQVLAVFCVNKKPLEEEMGVDLFYWDQKSDVFTFVQYKRLEKANSNVAGVYEWVYKRKGELTKQLLLMPQPQGVGEASKDWRMTESPFWFKFVRGDAAAKLGNQVLKGMYVPADWLRRAIDDDVLNSGPKGGFRVTYSNAKYIGRAAFTHLVSRGLIGTTSSNSRSFKKILKSHGKNRQIILAVKSEWNDPQSGSLPTDSGESTTLNSPF